MLKFHFNNNFKLKKKKKKDLFARLCSTIFLMVSILTLILLDLVPTSEFLGLEPKTSKKASSKRHATFR